MGWNIVQIKLIDNAVQIKYILTDFEPTLSIND